MSHHHKQIIIRQKASSFELSCMRVSRVTVENYDHSIERNK